jgi:hypothetical protein
MFGRYTVDRDSPGEEWYILDSDWPGRDQGQHQYPIYLPLGAVVAVATLVDVVPINRYAHGPLVGDFPHDGPLPHQQGGLWLIGSTSINKGHPTRIEQERTWDDFTPGRWAGLLADVRKLDRPIPAKGRRGLWEWNESEVAA